VRKVTQPYMRDTGLMDHKEGQSIILKIQPPGNTIGFRLKNGRTTWSIPTLDVYMAARYTANPGGSTEARPVPRDRKAPSVRDEIISTLKSKGRLNIAQIMKQMKEKGLKLERAQAGTILELMKEANLIKQDKFNYELVQK
jgi:hypothetical protein